jgi:hypothetical protein
MARDGGRHLEAHVGVGDLRAMSERVHTLREELGHYRDARRLALGLALVAALAGVGWLLLVREDGDASNSLGEPRMVSAAELGEFARSVGHPVYWVGERLGAAYELTQTADGQIYVRYLTDEAAIGNQEPDFLTVGTYPADDAARALREEAEARGAVLERATGGGLVVIDEDRPTSVYLAYPDSDYQIEVYDPSPERALELALTGRVQPAG